MKITVNMPAEPLARLRVGKLFQARISLWPDRITRGRESHPLDGVSAEVAGAGSVFTSTRFLTVSGPGFAWSYQVDRALEHRARRFAALVNATAAHGS